MKNKLKRTLSLFLVFCLFLTLAPMVAVAEPVVPLSTIFVPHTGNAAADEAALRNAFAQGSGYTIELETGTWHLTGGIGIELQEGQTLNGNGSTIHALSVGTGAVLRSRVDNVTLSDFTLIRTEWGNGPALCIGGREPGGEFSPYASDRSNNIVLKDITIQCDVPGGSGPSYVMSLHGVNGILMENLIFNIEYMSSGIRIASSVDVTIDNFTINSHLTVESVIFSYSPYYRDMTDGTHDYSFRDVTITGFNRGRAIQPWIYLFYSPPWPTTDNLLTLSLVDRFLSMDFETIYIENLPYVIFLHSTPASLIGGGTFLFDDLNELLYLSLLGLDDGINGLLGGLPWFGIRSGRSASCEACGDEDCERPDRRRISGLIIEMCINDEGDIIFNWDSDVPGVRESDPAWPGPGPYTATGSDLFTNVTFEIVYTTDGSDPRYGDNIFNGIAASTINADTIRAVGRITIRDNVSENYVVIFTNLLGESSYTVEFDLDGGNYGGNHEFLLQTVLRGQNATALTTEPSRPNYVFDGWTPELDLENVTENRTFVALWRPVREPGNGYDDDDDDDDDDNGNNGNGNNGNGPFSPYHNSFMIGRPSGNIYPQDNVRRSEVAAVLFRLLSDEVRIEMWSQENTFTDVNSSHWFNNEVSTITNMGVIRGLPDGSFAPNRAVTRAELAAIIARFFDETNDNGMAFTDIAGHWAEDYINQLAHMGWVQGHSDGTFRPNQPVTRAAFAAIICRMLDRVPDSVDALLDGRTQWPDKTDQTAWYYLYLQEASHSTEFERLPNGYLAWTELLEHIDWSVFSRPNSRPDDILVSERN